MKSRPILFQGAMVRALLDDTKTQTRRVVKPPEPTGLGTFRIDTGFKDGHLHPAMVESSPIYDGARQIHWVKRSPYGAPGDHLWVREAIRLVPDQPEDDGTGHVLSTYEADGSLTVADAWPWKRSYLPPMHCPRGLSRITLEITGVRVERLQDISEDDCYAEGIDTEGEAYNEGANFVNAGSPNPAARWAYASLWESINGRGPHHWNANPWVWCVEFRRIKP